MLEVDRCLRLFNGLPLAELKCTEISNGIVVHYRISLHNCFYTGRNKYKNELVIG
ncbi:MAG: hypothetical protein GY775_12265 [Candidatus Scalindua sp.]|nr:hypothetical protein [Candidatus Scalindua sp.]